jgi:hypothetical protein
MPTIAQLTQFDAISPAEFSQWCDEQGTPDALDISNLLDLVEVEVNSSAVNLEQAVRMLELSTKAIADANRRAAYSEVF